MNSKEAKTGNAMKAGQSYDKNEIILEVKDLKVYFDLKANFADSLFGKDKKQVKAVDDVSFSIKRGEILSLVGESGSGKTTTGKAILQLVKATAGEIVFNGETLNPEDKNHLKQFRQKAQMIFQDPYQALNPREIILDIIAEPLDVNQLVKTSEEREARVIAALEQAGLTPGVDFLYRYPYELSGGQRQRVVIAGAMVMNPDFIVADEPVSMLDASIRTGILKLMMKIREEKQLSYLFITHDLSLAWLISDRVAIMYLGTIMEIGSADAIIKKGLHPYTQALTSIMPTPGVNKGKKRVTLPGETPNATENIAGCKFRTRCSKAMSICETECPKLVEMEEGHLVACHLYEQN